MKRNLFASFVLTAAFLSCKKNSTSAEKFTKADVAISWNNFSIKTIKNEALNSNLSSRILAIEAIAVYDAVNAIKPYGAAYHYAATANANGSLEAAASQAAHDVLLAYFPNQKSSIDSALSASIQTISEGSVEEGQKTGAAAAADIIALRANDGAYPNQSYTSPANPGVGQYRATPAAFAPGINPQWGAVKPFLLATSAQFRPEAPPAVGTEPYNTALNKVKDIGAATSSSRVDAQTHIAQFYKQDAELTVNETARELIKSHNASLQEAAYVLLLTEIAEADARIAIFEAKYKYLYWRPVTALNANADGSVTNNYSTWSPLLATPPHPAYPCGHCGTVTAGLEILKSIYGDKNTFQLHTTTPNEAARTLETLSAVEEENGLSRIYGGIHYPFDVDNANDLGKKVAAYVLKKAPKRK